MSDPQDEPIAIIGLGCRFPGAAASPDAYWQMLCRGENAIVEIPGDRWDIRRFYDPDPERPGKTHARMGGFLRQKIDRFDPLFFGISPREAEGMDPQQRLLLEVTWEALEDAGLDVDGLAGSMTGVFIGGFCLDGKLNRLGPLNRELADSHSATSSTMTILANRISYTFDFRGPSVTMDTACSSSLVATHYACQALWNGECDLAVSGGVNLMFRPEYPIAMSKGRFLSQHGYCKAFAEDAGGYTRGEGSGIVILKSLSSALADGDAIHAVIRMTGVNQDGRTNGISMPNPEAQAALMQQVYHRAGVMPNEIGYVEAHGTGTQAGDPIEATALHQVLSKDRAAEQRCVVGSVKTNIGHLEAAAGVAGLIKATLALKHRQIPPNLHFDAPNPKIPFADIALRIPTALEPWPSGYKRAMAGVNSFGYGGTNAHVLLEEAPPPIASKGQNCLERTTIVPVSARSNDALKTSAGKYAFFLGSRDEAISLTDFLHSVTQRRSHHSHRLAVAAASEDELRERLIAFSMGEEGEGISSGRVAAELGVGPVFVYTGMGPQWWGMGRGLMGQSALFADSVRHCDERFREIAGWSVLEALGESESASRVAESQVAQPANFILQVALTELWRSLGITPSAIVGHSVGEVTAAYVAGALSLDDALLVSYHRSRLQQTLAGTGTMLAVGVDEAKAEELIAELPNVSVAAINSPNAVTLAGDEEALAGIAERVDAAGIFNRLLKVNIPYHSPQMEPIHDELLDVLSSIKPQAPALPLYSTVRGELSSEEDWGPEYWWLNVRQTVRFGDAMQALLSSGAEHFLEVGPHPVLEHSMRECAAVAERPVRLLASLRRKVDEWPYLLQTLGALYTVGFNVNWEALIPPSGRYVRLPTYPWQKERFWRESDVAREDRLGLAGHVFLNSNLRAPLPTWQVELNRQFFPYLSDHAVGGQPVFPGAGYIEAGLALHEELHGDDGRWLLKDLAFHNLLIVELADVQVMSASVDPGTGQFSVHSRVGNDATDWKRHATGYLAPTAELAPRKTVNRAQIEERCVSPITFDELYSSLAHRELNYGVYFRGVKKLLVGEEEFLIRIEGHEDLPYEADGYILHPTLLDAAFHTVLSTISGTDPYVLVSIDRVQVYERLDRCLWSHVRVSERRSRSLTASFVLFGDDGQAYAEVEGVVYQAISGQYEDRANSWFYRYTWQEAELPTLPQEIDDCLLIGKPGTLFDSVERALAATHCGLSVLNVVDGLNSGLSVALSSLRGPIVYVADGIAGGENVDKKAVFECITVTEIVRAAQAVSANRSWVLRIITSAAQAVVSEDNVDNLAAATLWGLGQVVENEHPNFDCKLIDVSTSDAMVATECFITDRDQDIAYRSGKRYARRLQRYINFKTESKEQINTVEPVTLNIGTPGQIDSLTYRRTERRPPAKGEIEVQVHSTAINFKDYLKVTGRLPARVTEGTYFDGCFGMECSGEVVALGEGVDNVLVGEHVVTPVRGGFSSYATVDARWAVPRPGALSETEAPVYIGFITAYYGLLDVAGLQAGEKVLIHNATGGVGLAAVQVATWLGAEIYATAGTDEKRAFLAQLGVQHIYDSRTLAFATEIRTDTDGYGIDVVLNAIAGEALFASVGLLAPYGRFVEIGKRDINDNSGLPMLAFNRNLSFTAIDIDRLYKDRPDVIGRIILAISAGFERGDFKPLPVTAFAAADAAEAFKMIGQSRHIGKVVVTMLEQEVDATIADSSDSSVEGTVLITGGTAGFGLEVARHLATNGTTNLVLASRRGDAADGVGQAVRELERSGASVHVRAIDVTDVEQLKVLFGEIEKTMPPLSGVFHCAMVLDDGYLAELEEQNYARVFGPKVSGAWNLHQLTANLSLKHFVLFSSISPVVGNVGQANYNAANTFLDTLAHHRRQAGLAGLSINWGVLLETGVVRRNEEIGDLLASSGISGFTTRDALSSLATALEQDVAQLGIFDIDWPRWQAVNPRAATAARFRELVERAGRGDKLDVLIQELEGREHNEKQGHVESRLRTEIAKVLKLPEDKLDVEQSMSSLGVDSLMTLELVMALKAELGIIISAMDLLKEPSIKQLATQVLGSVEALESC